MDFCVLGIDYKKTPIELREKVYFKESQKIDASGMLSEMGFKECMILATCNRSEIYYISDNFQKDSERIKYFLEEFFGVILKTEYIKSLSGTEAIRHVFHVAAGMDSLVPGEDQILGQMVDAHMDAMQLGFSGKIINKIIREAATASKHIKATSKVSSVPTSIAYLGVKKAEEDLGLKGKNILVIGAGEMGKLALSYLDGNESRLFISNRTYENSLKIKDQHEKINILPYGDIKENLASMDVLLTATSSPHTILGKKDFENLTSPLYIMDLSLPRDIEEDAAENELVTLINIDGLKSIIDRNLLKKREILNSYNDYIEEKIRETEKWAGEANLHSILSVSEVRCREIADDTLSYIFRKMDLKPGEKKKMEKVIKAAIGKVMKETLMAVKDEPDTEEKNRALLFLDGVMEKRFSGLR